MSRRVVTLTILNCSLVVGIVYTAIAQEPKPAVPPGPAKEGKGKGKQAARPPLFFREEWKQTAAGGEHGVLPESVGNPDLVLNLVGPTAKEMLLTGNAGDENNPIHVWTGMCTTPCAFTLRHKANFADLTGLARIRLVTKTSGFHQVHPIVKLADGTWLAGDRTDGSLADWIESEFPVSDIRWLRLDPQRMVTTGNWVNNPDLSKVDEIGFADLMPSSGHGPGGWADVAKIEVYAKPVAR
ncbi:MAG: hypothetical protein JWO19_2965 [Bryobacterales bacterium]|jgi:hypothetical protein|nr:hypothetical protein [Bryobacterales bacterium]